MKKLVIGAVAAAVLATSGVAAEYTLKFSHVVSDNTPKGKAANYFEKRLEELSGGKIDVQVYPSSQLYNDDAVIKALRLDSVQMAAPSFSKFGKIVPQLALFDMPFLFKDTDHLHRVQDSEVGQKLKDLITAKGIVALDFWDAGFKQFSSSKKPLIEPKDAEGQKFRIMSSKVLEAQIKAVGGNPQMLPFSEVYSGLQQGVIDAAENPISNIYTKKFHEVQTSLTMSDHGYLGYLVVMSNKFWKSLPADLQANVKQALKEATEKEREYAVELDKIQLDEIKQYAKDSGRLEIITLTPEQKDAWRKAMQPVYHDKEIIEEIGQDLIDGALNTK